MLEDKLHVLDQEKRRNHLHMINIEDRCKGLKMKMDVGMYQYIKKKRGVEEEPMITPEKMKVEANKINLRRKI